MYKQEKKTSSILEDIFHCLGCECTGTRKVSLGVSVGFMSLEYCHASLREVSTGQVTEFVSCDKCIQNDCVIVS